MAVADTALAGARRRRIDRRRLGRASRRRRHGRSRQAGSAARLRRRARQRRLRRPYRRQAKNGRRIRGGGAHGPHQNRQSAGGRELHGAALARSREYDRANRPIHAERGNSGRARHQGRDRGPDSEDPARSPCASSLPTSAAALAPSQSSIANIRWFSRRPGAWVGPSAGWPIAPSISSATRKAATT